MNSLVKHAFLTLSLLLVTFLFTYCDKIEEESRKNNSHVNLSINGKEYRNSKSPYCFLETSYPIVAYEFTESRKRFSLVTDCVPEGQKDYSSSDVLALEFYIFLEKELEVGRKYFVHSLPDLDYRTPYGTVDIYREKKASFCYLNINNTSENDCFGNGFVEFTKVDLENFDIEGVFEFHIPFSKEKLDNPPIVNVKGNFKAIK